MPDSSASVVSRLYASAPRMAVKQSVGCIRTLASLGTDRVWRFRKTFSIGNIAKLIGVEPHLRVQTLWLSYHPSRSATMASLVSPVRHAVSVSAPLLRLPQRRWAQVHDIRFLATHQKPDKKVLDKYRAKLEQKAKA